MPHKLGQALGTLASELTGYGHNRYQLNITPLIAPLSGAATAPGIISQCAGQCDLSESKCGQCGGGSATPAWIYWGGLPLRT